VKSDSTTTMPALASDLIARAQQGDSDAFAGLFDAHKTRVYSLCFRMTNNTAEAEDLAQEAFMQVFRKLASFRGDSAFSTWLYRITVNTVLMHFRRKSLQRVSLDEPYRNHENSGTMRREYGTKDSRLESSVSRVALTRAIGELPEGCRAIFLLHEVEGYQHREIAELLGCSVGTSKSQLHKAKLKIRDFLTYTPQTQSEIDLGNVQTSVADKSQCVKASAKWELPGNLSPVIPVNTTPGFSSAAALGHAFGRSTVLRGWIEGTV
jgi:RNA polymerase sigma-70 factor, ECF subfamily